MEDTDAKTTPVPARTRPPSAGLVLMTLSVLATVGFFVFALRQPAGDRLWWLLQELKIGKRTRLHSGDELFLRRMLERYPDLGPSLRDDKPAGLLSANTDGWIETKRAYLLADPGGPSDPVVMLNWRPEKNDCQGPVVLEGEGRRIVALEGPGSVTLALSSDLRAGQLITVRLDPAGGREGEGVGAGLQIVFPTGTRKPKPETRNSK